MQTDTSKSGRWNLLFNRYKSVMNIIIRANNELFRREKPMCEALMELMQEDLRKKRAHPEETCKGKICRRDCRRFGRIRRCN